MLKHRERKFPALSGEKINLGVFDGSHVWWLSPDEQFWRPLRKKNHGKFLLRLRLISRGKIIKVWRTFAVLKLMSRNISVKVNFLHSHLDDYFSENHIAISDQGKRFHCNIETMETRYQGRRNANMISNYCQCLRSGCHDASHSRKAE